MVFEHENGILFFVVEFLFVCRLVFSLTLFCCDMEIFVLSNAMTFLLVIYLPGKRTVMSRNTMGLREWRSNKTF